MMMGVTMTMATMMPFVNLNIPMTRTELMMN